MFIPVYKREVNKSMLHEGFAIERKYIEFFTDRIGKLERGEKRQIFIVFEGKTYPVDMINLNHPYDKPVSDQYQIRYTPDGEFARVLQGVFHDMYKYIQKEREIFEKTGKNQRFRTNIPEEYKEYIVIYQTENTDTFLCEPILAGELSELRDNMRNTSELNVETELNNNLHDDTAGIEVKLSVQKIRKYNRSICDSLKKYYNYRCQICGKAVGGEYDTQIAEVHHIDYFVKSLNNDVNNLLVVCPNHHSIIHNCNPKFDRKKCIYIFILTVIKRSWF